jgi:hypothetical protein
VVLFAAVPQQPFWLSFLKNKPQDSKLQYHRHTHYHKWGNVGIHMYHIDE